MKSIIAASAALLSISSGVIAQEYTQSKPFHLIIEAPGSKYNGVAFGTCHEGAAIESLCLGYGNSTFQFNTTSAQETSNQAYGTPGLLTYSLPLGGASPTEYVSEPMTFLYYPSTNVALPLFEPGENGQQVAFDSQDRMNVQVYLDDTVTPPTSTKDAVYYRWYVCETNYEGYVYETLAWVVGKAKPQNPSCEKVTVVRRFV